MSENNNLDKCADCPVRFAMLQRSNSLQAQYNELQAMSEEHLLGTEIEDAIEQIETEAGNGIPPTEEEKSHIASGVRQITASKLDFLEGCIDEITKLWDDLPNNCDKPLKLRANKPGVGKFAVILCTAPDSNGLVTAAVERS